MTKVGKQPNLTFNQTQQNPSYFKYGFGHGYIFKKLTGTAQSALSSAFMVKIGFKIPQILYLGSAWYGVSV
jgi:hypothetical protein